MMRKVHPKLSFIVVADGLCSKQPFVQDLGGEDIRFVLAAKDTDHEVLMQYVDGARRLGEVPRMEVKDLKGRIHVYEWINNFPLNGNLNGRRVREQPTDHRTNASTMW